MGDLEDGSGMTSAVLRAEDVPGFCPVTNLYECSDGRWLLVQVGQMQAPAPVQTALGGVEITRVIGSAATVYVANADGQVCDAAGDPSDEMAALAVFDDASDHVGVLARLGVVVG